MGWNIDATNVATAVLVGAGGWIGNYYRKKLNPFIKAFKDIMNGASEIMLLKIKDAAHDADMVMLRTAFEDEIFVLRGTIDAILHTDPHPNCRLNTERDLVYCNPAYLLMVDADNERDLLGKGYMKLIPKEDKEEIRELSDTLRKTPSSDCRKIRFIKEDGTIVITLCRSEPIFNKQGQVIKVIVRFKILNEKL